MAIPRSKRGRVHSGVVVERSSSGFSNDLLASIPHLNFDPHPDLDISVWFNVSDSKLRFLSSSGEIYESDRDIEIESSRAFANLYVQEDSQAEFETGSITGLVVVTDSLLLDKVDIPTDKSLIDISCGETFISIVRSDGSVWSQGNNFFGQLGNGTREGLDDYIESEITGGVTGIAAGGFHCIALKNDGTVWAWGRNDHGQVGNNSQFPTASPVQILTDVTTVASGKNHSLARKIDGSLWSWGSNEKGQLGLGDTVDRLIPTEVIITGGTITTIGCGYHHSLFVRNDGVVFGCGQNTFLQLGDNEGEVYEDDIIVKNPVQIDPIILTDIISVVGGECHSIALKDDGTIWCWGSNRYEQLCRDKNSVVYGIYESVTPLQVFEEDEITPVISNKIRAGQFSSYAYDTGNNKLRSWGLHGLDPAEYGVTQEFRLGFCSGWRIDDESYDIPKDVWNGTDLEVWSASFKCLIWQRDTFHSFILYGVGDNQYGQLFGLDTRIVDTITQYGSNDEIWYADEFKSQIVEPYILEGVRIQEYDISLVGATTSPKISVSIYMPYGTTFVLESSITTDNINWTRWRELYRRTIEGDVVGGSINFEVDIPEFPLMIPTLTTVLKVRTRLFSRGNFSPRVDEIIIDIPSIFV